MNIEITFNKEKKQKPDDDVLGFGNYFSDHMFAMEYKTGAGWIKPRILPYSNIRLAPSAMCLHYGQAVFEGLKAYHTADGRDLLFRPRKNFERLNVSNRRMCIPKLDVDFCVHSLKELLKVDRNWIPKGEGTSLYIRPFIIAVDPYLGVRPAYDYLFMIILSPVGAYYKEGLNPVKIWVEDKYVRAVKGGIGEIKAAANYAASLKSQAEAAGRKYTQVLWLDGVERKYVEEVGTMNIFFKIDGEFITPKLQGSILPGITRMSCIELLKSWGEKVTERLISIDEVMSAAREGRLEEAFGSGTAAVISPIGELTREEEDVVINGGNIGKYTKKLYDELTGIQYGRVEDTFGWTEEI